MYQTQRLSDNTLITIDTATGKPVTSRYTDTERDAMKQSLMWDIQAETQASPENIFSSLMSGVYVDKRLPWFAEASKRYNDLKRYSNYSQKEFETSLANGMLLPWTQLYNDLIKDPKIKLAVEKAQALNKINGVSTDLNTIFQINIWLNLMVDLIYLRDFLQITDLDFFHQPQQHGKLVKKNSGQISNHMLII
jgi:hypothetical protein